MIVKTFVAAAVALAAVVLAAPRPACALRIGVYGSSGAGGAQLHDSRHDRGDVSRDTTHAGYGLVLDTGSPRTLADYRISLGWERIEYAAERGAPAATLEGVVVDQDLMFNLVRHPGPLRIWLGPEFRFAFFNSLDTRATGGKEDHFSLGVGPALGFDFALNPALALSWKLGYLIGGLAGGGSDGFSMNEGHVHATFAILFGAWSGRPDRQRPERHPRDQWRERPYPRGW